MYIRRKIKFIKTLILPKLIYTLQKCFSGYGINESEVYIKRKKTQNSQHSTKKKKRKEEKKSFFSVKDIVKRMKRQVTANGKKIFSRHICISDRGLVSKMYKKMSQNWTKTTQKNTQLNKSVKRSKQTPHQGRYTYGK